MILNTVSISGKGMADATVVPDSFLTNYMPYANGEFVKVYLLTLKELQKGRTVTPCRLADLLNAPESDVIRALIYWNKQGLLIFDGDDDPERSSETEDAAERLASAEKKGTPASGGTVMDSDDGRRKVTSQEFTYRDNQGNDNVISMVRPKKADSSTKSDLTSKMEDPEFSALVKIAQSLLRENLSHNDVDNLLYFYYDLHFPADMIEYLITLSMERGKTNFSYMKKIAENWDAQGIHTVEAAKTEAEQHSDTVRTVSRAFGLNRNVAPEELRYIERWKNVYKMSDELIEEACNRAVIQAKGPAFPYVEKVLKSWSEEGVCDRKTMELSDEAHHIKAANEAKMKAQAEKIKAASAASKSSVDPSVGFPQRSDDIDSLAIQLQIESSQ